MREEISWSSTSRVTISTSFWMRSLTLFRSRRPIFSSTETLSTDAARSDRRARSAGAAGAAPPPPPPEFVRFFLGFWAEPLELVDEAADQDVQVHPGVQMLVERR